MFADVLFFGRVIAGRDVAFYHLPMKKIVRDLLLSGELPLWNRLIAGGQPLAANPAYELFYPPQLLILTGDFILGFHLHILVHLAIAAIGMYALVRHLGGGPAAAFAGACSFGFGGLVMSFVQLLPFLFATSWLPWILFFASRFARDRRMKDAALAALALAMQVLIGEPVVFLQTCMLLLAGAFVAESRRRDVVAVAAIVAAALLVGAVQLVPAVDFARDTARGLALPYETVAAWSLPPVRPVEFFYPAFAGRTSNDGALYFGGHRLYGRAVPYLYSIYLGLLVAIAAMAGLLRRCRGWKLVSGVAGASYLLALGAHTPLLKALYEAHLFSSIRYPEKWFISAVVAIAVFGALSLQRMIDGDRALILTAAVCAAAVAAGAGIAWSCTFLPGYTSTFARLWAIGASAELPILSAMARADWLLAFLRSAALVLVIVLFRSRRDLALPMAMAFLVADLVPRVGQVVRRDDRVMFEAPPLLRQLPPPDRLGRIYNDASIDRLIFKRAAFRPDEQYWIRRNGLYPFFPALWRQAGVLEQDIDNTFLLNTTVFDQLAVEARFRGDPNFPRLFMDLGNADTLLAAIDERAELARAGSPDRAAVVRVIRFPAAPRYSFASRVEEIRSPADLETRMRAGRIPRGTSFAPLSLAPPAGGVVHGVRETAREAIIDVTASGTSYLVASVTFHRYWNATIDGASARIIPTNLCFQGLIVPPGRHQIRFTYRNPMVAIGATISALALCGLMVVLARSTART